LDGEARDDKTLAGFDFSFQPSLERPDAGARPTWLYQTLRGNRFFRPAWNRQKPSGHGAWRGGGKSREERLLHHLADLLGALARAEREGKLAEKIRLFCRWALLVVDEIGYLPVLNGGGNLFVQLVNAG
jgi:hypothetical protein